jgi:hypothetical protein
VRDLEDNFSGGLHRRKRPCPAGIYTKYSLSLSNTAGSGIFYLPPGGHISAHQVDGLKNIVVCLSRLPFVERSGRLKILLAVRREAFFLLRHSWQQVKLFFFASFASLRFKYFLNRPLRSTRGTWGTISPVDVTGEKGHALRAYIQILFFHVELSRSMILFAARQAVFRPSRRWAER